mmetsp:Transcript_65698/g.207896  ORF Transcript_65698/g.207896 Transcript_65698/m.207896 type:complete len:286 (+) Transcript_65698:227-1084(+)
MQFPSALGVAGCELAGGARGPRVALAHPPHARAPPVAVVRARVVLAKRLHVGARAQKPFDVAVAGEVDGLPAGAFNAIIQAAVHKHGELPLPSGLITLASEAACALGLLHGGGGAPQCGGEAAGVLPVVLPPPAEGALAAHVGAEEIGIGDHGVTPPRGAGEFTIEPLLAGPTYPHRGVVERALAGEGHGGGGGVGYRVVSIPVVYRGVCMVAEHARREAEGRAGGSERLRPAGRAYEAAPRAPPKVEGGGGRGAGSVPAAVNEGGEGEFGQREAHVGNHDLPSE